MPYLSANKQSNEASRQSMCEIILVLVRLSVHLSVEIHVHSVTPKPIEGFLNNLANMTTCQTNISGMWVQGQGHT